jgi:branched-chain amino acid transport system permease protein
MVGAFACAAVAAATGSFWLGLAASLAAAALAGAIIEIVVIRRLYKRDHLDQVLATFALILIFSEGTRWLFGSFPLYLDMPPLLSGAVPLPGGIGLSALRLAIIAHRASSWPSGCSSDRTGRGSASVSGQARPTAR